VLVNLLFNLVLQSGLNKMLKPHHAFQLFCKSSCHASFCAFTLLAIPAPVCSVSSDKLRIRGHHETGSSKQQNSHQLWASWDVLKPTFPQNKNYGQKHVTFSVIGATSLHAIW
jgi:hypothetical protein